MTEPRTMYEKIWDQHSVVADQGGQTLLYVDRLMCSEGSFHAFNVLRSGGYKVRRPEQVLAVPDHYTPSRGTTMADVVDDARRKVIGFLDDNAEHFGVPIYGLGDIRRGIQHIVGPEQGLTQPGLVLLCSDSHTATHGALGCLAFGIGGELAHVFATQCIWQRKPKMMRIAVDGHLGTGVTAKDVILAIIGKIGAAGGVGHAIEYSGSAIRDLSIEGRMTVCNMSIEAGSRTGLVAVDEKTVEYVRGRPFAPREPDDWDAATSFWATLGSDSGAKFDKDVSLDGGAIEPMVTWGNSPENAIGVTGVVPHPSDETDEKRRFGMERSYEYMDLKPGDRISDIEIDQVFIGSCTNSRIEDLRAAATVAKGRKAKVPTLVVPGSGLIKKQAEEEGLDRVFTEAGFRWGEPGCSMCVSMNGDQVGEGKRCASTSNRNFRGRQGKGSRTHLVSPIMAVAASVSGRLSDVRDLL